MIRAFIAFTTAFALTACATPLPAPESSNAQITSAVADAGRPAEDVARDSLRKPTDMLTFAQVEPGDTVAEMLPGGGYFTRLLSKSVGPDGRVVALVPAGTAKDLPEQIDPIRALIASGTYPNVSLELPETVLAPSMPVDLIWTSQNYHDIHAYSGAEAAAGVNRAVFAALKPGGTYLIIDHSAQAGSGLRDVLKLHRIDIAVVKSEALAAGFVLDGESEALANPADDRSLVVFDPTIRGKSDQFVLRFKKPK